MVATMNSLATRSSLELMLEKLQQREDRPDDGPPALPVRPVSRARLPRARKPLQLHSQSEDSKRTECRQTERNATQIQKCYRGHQVRWYYKEITRVTLVLQSFIRGENARRDFVHSRNATLWAIIVIQKQARNYFKHRLLQDHQSAVETQLQSDRTQVPYSVLVDLQKQVLRSEAKVRGKDEENLALRRRLEEIEKKWRAYEERMRSMEKEWQDQFTYIQECLVAAKNNHNQNRGTITIRTNSVYQQQVDQGEMVNGTEAGHEKSCVELHPRDELRKLKNRFKAWKKEYRYKLKNLWNSESEKRRHWWGRLTH